MQYLQAPYFLAVYLRDLLLPSRPPKDQVAYRLRPEDSTNCKSTVRGQRQENQHSAYSNPSAFRLPNPQASKQGIEPGSNSLFKPQTIQQSKEFGSNSLFKPQYTQQSKEFTSTGLFKPQTSQQTKELDSTGLYKLQTSKQRKEPGSTSIFRFRSSLVERKGLLVLEQKSRQSNMSLIAQLNKFFRITSKLEQKHRNSFRQMMQYLPGINKELKKRRDKRAEDRAREEAHRRECEAVRQRQKEELERIQQQARREQEARHAAILNQKKQQQNRLQQEQLRQQRARQQEEKANLMRREQTIRRRAEASPITQLSEVGRALLATEGEQNRTRFNSMQSHQKSLQAIERTGLQIRETLFSLQQREAVLLVRDLFLTIKHWMQCAQKDRIEVLPPEQVQSQVYKNVLSCFALLAHSSFKMHPHLLQLFQAAFLSEARCLLQPRTAYSSYKQLELFESWLAAGGNTLLKPTSYCVRVDQLCYMLCALLLYELPPVSEHLIRRSGGRANSSQADHSLFWALARQVVQGPSNLYTITFCINMMQAIVPFLTAEAVPGPYSKLCKALFQKSQEAKAQLARCRQLFQQLQRAHEDGQFFEKILVKNMSKKCQELWGKVARSQAGSRECGEYDVLYFFK